MKKSVLLVLCVLWSGAVWPAAGDKEDVSRLLHKTVDGVLAAVRNKSHGREQRRDEVMEVVRPVFDFDIMAKLTLGRVHWPKLKAAEKKEFTDLFVQQLQSSYLDKVELVSEEKVEYDAPVQEDKKISILTRVLTKTEAIKLGYRFHKTGAGWKVYDVEIQGVSLVKSYGLQYQQVLQTGTVADLLAKMREKIKSIEAENRKAAR